VRGCLFVLILAAIFVVAGAWFAGPPIAGAVVTTALTSAGVHAEHLDVAVESDPPLELALGQADRVVVHGTGVEWHGIQAQTLDLTLEDVDLPARTAASVEGRMTGVELPNVSPPSSTATIDIAGPGDAATATITIDGPTFEAIASEAFNEKLGIRPASVTLAEPNVLRVVAGPITASSVMTVAPDGSLGVATPIGNVTVLAADPARPFHLTSVEVQDGSLVLSGTFDVAELFG
jgi:LmeA-like phospholipid-binding